MDTHYTVQKQYILATMAATSSEEAQEAVIHCDTEEEYYKALDNAGNKLVVVDCFAEWYVQTIILAHHTMHAASSLSLQYYEELTKNFSSVSFFFFFD